MKHYDHEYIEGKIEEHNQRVYGGTMEAHSKGVLRQMLKADEDYAAREEIEHSNSPVGDRNNMRTYE